MSVVRAAPPEEAVEAPRGAMLLETSGRLQVESVLEAVQLRLPALDLRRVGTGVPAGQFAGARVWVLDGIAFLELVMSDGRVFEREIALDDEIEAERAVATELVSLYTGAVDGSLGATHEQAPLEWPATLADPPGPTPWIALGPGTHRPLPPPEFIPPPPAGRRWGVRVGSTLGGALIPPPSSRSAFGAGQIGVHVGRKWAADLGVRLAGWRTQRESLARLRMSAGALARPSMGRFVVPITVFASVEPWWARGVGKLSARRRPLFGVGVRAVPSLSFANARLDGHVGLALEVAASAIVASGLAIPRVFDATDALAFRLGGIDASIGVEIGIRPHRVR